MAAVPGSKKTNPVGSGFGATRFFGSSTDEKYDEKEKEDVQQGKDYSQLEHILVVGDTGVGKSSLIKLLTKNSKIRVASSKDPKSCTKDIAPFKMLKTPSKEGIIDKSAEYYVIWDTQGTQDSDFTEGCKVDEMINQDHGILNKIQRSLYTAKATKVKILWIVEPSIKAKKSLHFQAGFINKLGDININNNNNNNNSIWNSVLLIVKEPKPATSLIDSAQGAIATIKDVIDNKQKYPQWEENKNLIGYTNIEWLALDRKPSDMEDVNDLYVLQEKKKKKKYHYYKSKEIETLVKQCLSKSIECFKVKWCKDKCIKCGIEGDHRFLNHEKCHLEVIAIHPGKLIKNHLGAINDELTFDHDGHLNCYHPGDAVERFHKGNLKRIHSQHPGGWYKNANDAINDGGFWGAVGGVIMYAETIVAGPLIGSAVGAIGGWCTYCGKNMKSTGCMDVYDCCNNYESNPGCKEWWDKKNRHLCCQEKFCDSNGCTGYYTCCSDKEFKVKNGKIVGNKVPCVKKCDNCGDLENTSTEQCGFLWDCCKYSGKVGDGNEHKNHCQSLCKLCNRPWGRPSRDKQGRDKYGCHPTAKHDFNLKK